MDYAEILLQAVDTVVNERISNLPFDKTVICTVIDNSKKDQGIYTLSYEATTFEAYSDKTNYSKDAQVLVVIPEGNWGARKQIIARYVEPNEAIPVKYVSPLEEIVAGTDVTFTLEESFGIAANDDRLKVGSIGTAGKPGYMKLIHSWQNLNINTSNLNYLGLSVDFKTLFENLSIVSGDYGLIIEINYNDNTKSIFDFNSSKDFFGNVYGYFGWTTQEQAYELTQNKTIVGMNCYLFHYDEIKYKKESDGTAEKLEPIPLTDGNFYKNILIQNLNIFFGKLKSEAYKREVILRSDKDTFKKGSNIVNLTFEWINLDGFDDGFFGEASSDPDNKPNKYEVYWYLDDATGNFQDTSASFTEDGKIITTKEWYVSTNLTEARAKVVVIRQGVEYTSNEIRVRNQDKLTTADKEDVKPLVLEIAHMSADYIYSADGAKPIQQLTLDSKDSYDFYGAEGKITSSFYTKYPRKLKAVLKSYGKEVIFPPTNIATAIWTCPESNTMLEAIKDKNSSSEIKEEFWYNIKNAFFPYYTDNTIKCEVEIPEDFDPEDINKDYRESKRIILTAEKKFSFSQQGAQGGKNNLSLRPIGRNFPFTKINEEQEFELMALSGGEFVAFDEKSKIKYNNNEIAWSYKKKTIQQDQKDADTNEPIKDKDGNIIQEFVEIEDTTTINFKLTLPLSDILNYNSLTVETSKVSKEFPLVYCHYDYDYLGYPNIIPTEIKYHVYGNLQTTERFELGGLLDHIPTEPEGRLQWQVFNFGGMKSMAPQINNFGFLIVPKTYDISAPDEYKVILQYQDSGNNIIYSSPLKLYKDKYESEMLNEWSGSNEKIFAATAVFGQKENADGEDQNTFTGTVIGKVGSDIATAETGIFGYKKGSQVYALRDDGSFFVGQSGKSYMLFDPEKEALNIEGNIIMQGGSIDWNSVNKPEIDITINPEDIKEAVGDQLDRITETFYQNTDPSILWGDDDKALHEGDFWKCSEVTGDGKPKGSEWQYQKISEDEYVWIRVDIFNEVFDEIDGKSTIYTTMDNSTSTTMPAESEIQFKQGDLFVPSENIPIYTFDNHQQNSTKSTKDYNSGIVYKCKNNSKGFYHDDWVSLAYTTSADIETFQETVLEATETKINNEWVISPKIGGGFLFIGADENGKQKSYCVINPQKQDGCRDESIFKIVQNNQTLMEVSNENSSAKAILAGWNISTNGMISENKKMRLYSTPYYNSEEEIAVGNYSPRSKGWYIIAGVGEKPDDSNYTPAAFGVDANGYMCCKNGYVGNWTIDSRGIGNEIHYFYNDWDTNFKVQVGSAEKNDWRLLMGRNNQNKAYFGVDANGFLYCAGGEIGGWYISHYNLSKNPGSNKEGSIVFLNGSMETVETICGVVKDDWVIGCGKRIKSGNFNYNDVYNFGIDSNGNMYCQNAHLSGILECIAPSDYTGNLATFGQEKVKKYKKGFLDSADTMSLIKNYDNSTIKATFTFTQPFYFSNDWMNSQDAASSFSFKVYTDYASAGEPDVIEPIRFNIDENYYLSIEILARWRTSAFFNLINQLNLDILATKDIDGFIIHPAMQILNSGDIRLENENKTLLYQLRDFSRRIKQLEEKIV